MIRLSIPCCSVVASGVISFIMLAAGAWGNLETIGPKVVPIRAAMARAQIDNQERLRPYTVTRDYQVFGEDRRTPPKSQVTVEVSFVPPDSETYVIRHTGGSSFGVKAIRRMLEGEMELTNDSSADISEANYNFHFVGEEDWDGYRCYVLELHPKREDKNLLRGNIWVDANTYLLRRAEGVPARNPSWWVKNVHIVLLYGDAGGMWLQTELEATAEVRILGKSTVISRDIRVLIGDTVAAR
jgi:hypothetical protein